MTMQNIAIGSDHTVGVKIDVCNLLSRRSSCRHLISDEQRLKTTDSMKLGMSLSPTSSNQKLRASISIAQCIDSMTMDHGSTEFDSKGPPSLRKFMSMSAPIIPAKDDFANMKTRYPSIPPVQPQRCQSITLEVVADEDNHLVNDNVCIEMISVPPIQPQRCQSIDATAISCRHQEDINSTEYDDGVYQKHVPPLPSRNKFGYSSPPPLQPQRCQSIEYNEKSQCQLAEHPECENRYRSRLSFVEECLEESMESLQFSKILRSDSVLSRPSMMHSRSRKNTSKSWSSTTIDCLINDDDYSIVSDVTEDSFHDYDDYDVIIEDSHNATKHRVLKETRKNTVLPMQNAFSTHGNMSFASIVPRRRPSRKHSDGQDST